MMLEDPYAYVVAAFQAPPSPDYVPGPEGPEQAPLSPEFVPEPVYPKFMPPEDEVFPAEEQPLPAVVSPTADSPGYIADSNPEEDEEDPEEEPKEDPEEDPTDYPADRGDDDDDDDESSDDDEDEDDDDDVEEDEEDEEDKKEHPASADSVPPPIHHVTARMSVRAQIPISLPSDTEVARFLAILTLPSSSLSPWSSPLPQIPSPLLPSILSPLPASPPLPISSPPPLAGTPPLLPIPLPTPSPPLLLSSINRREDVREVCLLPQKRLYNDLGPRYEVGKSSSAPTARPTGGFRVDYGFVATLDDEIRRDPEGDVGYGITDTWDEMLVGMPGAPTTDDTELGRRMTEFATIVRDRPAHARTAQQADIGALRVVDRTRQAQFVKVPTLMKSLQAHVIALQGQQGPARGLAQPEIPEEASSSS
ncbi:hypothetical protein Tco_1144342 [Tanacetum coccineum]